MAIEISLNVPDWSLLRRLVRFIDRFRWVRTFLLREARIASDPKSGPGPTFFWEVSRGESLQPGLSALLSEIRHPAASRQVMAKSMNVEVSPRTVLRPKRAAGRSGLVERQFMADCRP